MAEDCAWCELEVDTNDRQSIRLSNTQPPWSARSAWGAAAAIGAMASTISAAMRTEPVITLWFHRSCWHEFVALLRGRHEAG